MLVVSAQHDVSDAGGDVVLKGEIAREADVAGRCRDVDRAVCVSEDVGGKASRTDVDSAAAWRAADDSDAVEAEAGRQNDLAVLYGRTRSCRSEADRAAEEHG